MPRNRSVCLAFAILASCGAHRAPTVEPASVDRPGASTSPAPPDGVGTAPARAPLTAEDWFRVGEQAFDGGDLAKAIDAYQRVGDAPGLATIAAYKLAWSHWRRADMVAATASFHAFLERRDPDAATFAPEARQYLAFALIEEDQDGDGAPEPTPTGAATASIGRVLDYLGNGADASRRAVVATAADSLVDEARFAEADVLYARLLTLRLTVDEQARVSASRHRARSLQP